MVATRPCVEEAARAYGDGHSGLMRHTDLDVCAFYDESYGVVRVNKRRWNEAQA